MEYHNVTSKISYLITWENSSLSHQNNLQIILTFLSSFSELEVIVVEQGMKPPSPSIVVPENCQYVTVYNNAGFNKSWGINVAAKLASGTSYLIGDADIIIQNDLLTKLIKKLQNGLDAVNPFDSIVKLKPTQTTQFVTEQGLVNLPGLIEEAKEHQTVNVSFSSGVFGITKSFYKQLGGMDERFYGPGCDIAMSVKITKSSKNITTMQEGFGYHLWHEPTINDSEKNIFLIRNRSLLSVYNEMDQDFISRLWRYDSRFNGDPDKYRKLASQGSQSALPLVTCLCITRARVELLQRSIACFRRQNYINKELLILCEDDDHSTIEYVKTISDTNIRYHIVPTDNKKTLGELRNLSIELAAGEYFCQWDDDDWYDPRRISKQLYFATKEKKAASILPRWLIFSTIENKSFCSHVRFWEGSILCRKDFFHSSHVYKAVSYGEEIFLVQELILRDQAAIIDCPELYIYIYTGKNTWNANHFNSIISVSSPLNDQENKSLQKRLTSVKDDMKKTCLPRIIHQTADTASLSSLYKHCQQQIIKTHPGWDYRFYDDNDCRLVVSNMMPELLEIYDRLPLDIQRVDLFRLIVVYLFGGVYADLDIEILRPLDDLTKYTCVFAEEKTITEQQREKLAHTHCLRIANYMFAAVPQDPFIGRLIMELVKRGMSRSIESDRDVLETTGPGMVTDVYHTCCNDYAITLLKNNASICPVCDDFSCTFGDYAKHLHTGSWRSQVGEAESIETTDYPAGFIHQSWKSTRVPSLFNRLSKSWKYYHPEWRYCLWTDDDNRNHIKQHYPWFLEKYDSYPYHIQRVDAARYFILYSVGGLYVDMDSRCLKPITSLIKTNEIILGEEHPYHAELFNRSKIIGNAFMFARFSGHPFFRAVIEELATCTVTSNQDNNTYVLETTGPLMLTRVYEQYEKKKSVILLPHDKLYPINSQFAENLLNSKEEDEAFIKKTKAYAIHYHCGSWWKDSPVYNCK